MDDFEVKNLIGVGNLEFAGYNSAGDKTTLNPNLLIRGSKNVLKTLRGTIANRPGIKVRGEIDGTAGGVKSSFEWSTNVGTTRPMRVCNGKLQVENDLRNEGEFVWEDLYETSSLASPAANFTRFVFDTWWDNDEKTDRLVMVRGDDKILHWSGGMAMIESVTTNTITIVGTDTVAELGFATNIVGEKKLIIGGAEYTYTGVSGTSFTGVTPDPLLAGVSSETVVAQAVMVGDNMPIDNFKADFCKTIANQLWVGSYSSRIIYISADITVSGTLGFLNFTNTGGLVLGDPDAIIMDSPGKGIGLKDGYIVLFSGDSDVLLVTPNTSLPVSQAGATSLTTSGGSATRNIIQRIEKKKLAGLASALGHEFIGNLGEYLIWLDQKNRLQALGTFANIQSLKPANLSLPVQKELSEDDFTDGHLRVIQDDDGETVYITAPNNARDWMYQIRNKIDESGQILTERIWQPPQIRGVSRFAVIDGLIYGHSNAYPQIYQIWETNQYHDDHPSEEEIPYTSRAFLAYNNSGDRLALKKFDKVYFEGYMPEGTDLRAKVYYDYQGATDTRDLIISDGGDNVADFWLGNYPPSLGDSSLGDNPLGDGIIPEGGEQELIPKFRAVNSVDPIDHFEYAVEVYSTEEDARWELICLGTNVMASPNSPTFLTK